MREHGAKLTLTYQGDRVKEELTRLAHELGEATVLPCDVSEDESIAALRASLEGEGVMLGGLVHSIAFVKWAIGESA
jgi:enoyl-[acyl-carrier protein] reductase I